MMLRAQMIVVDVERMLFSSRLLSRSGLFTVCCFLFRIQCSTSYDVLEFGFILVIRLQYPLRYACRTLACANRFFDSIYNRFQSIPTVKITLPNGLDVQLVLCTLGNLISK